MLNSRVAFLSHEVFEEREGSLVLLSMDPCCSPKCGGEDLHHQGDDRIIRVLLSHGNVTSDFPQG